MKRILKQILLLFILFIITGLFIRSSVVHEEINEYSISESQTNPAFLKIKNNWIDSVFNSLTPDEKIAQLFMLGVSANQDSSGFNDTKQLIMKYNPGGIILFRSSPQKQVVLINELQKDSKTPLLVAIDGEWGLAMRTDSTVRYPMQMMLGALENEQLIYQMGKQIAAQLKRMGIHINFAPVADINNNINNPVINSRSFGENRVDVARKCILYMKGMQDNNILAVAKHFPGHGDTDVDSHLDLPVINHSVNRLDSIELYPFKELIKSGIGGVMSAHLFVPSLDSTRNNSSSLSYRVIDSLLKNKLHFKGIVFTDAMNMGAISKYHEPCEANYLAIKAGNDIILMPHELPNTIELIKQKIAIGELDQEEIDYKCKKILKLKYWSGLSNYHPAKLTNLNDDLNNPEYSLLNRKLVENSLSLIINKNNIIPLARPDTLKILSLSINADSINLFQSTLDKYALTDKICINDSINDSIFSIITQKAKQYNLIIISLHATSILSTLNYGLTEESFRLVDYLARKNNVVLSLFANPYSLLGLRYLKDLKAILVAYENNENTYSLSAQLLFGSIAANGKLPVTIGAFHAGTGIKTGTLDRFKYTIPVEAGMDIKILSLIDTIAINAIKEQIMPGCQILVAKNGMVVFDKSYGYHTYKNEEPVKSTDLYDIASITKVAATLPLLMYYYDKELIDIDDKISKYLPELYNSNKKNLLIKDILAHQAKLIAYMPFYISTIEPILPDEHFSNTSYSESYPIKTGANSYVNKHLKYINNCYSTVKNDTFSIQVADNLYMNKIWCDSIYNQIAESELYKKNEYKYSDLGYYWFYKVLDNLSSNSFEKSLDSFYYKPLGMFRTCFNPLERFSKEEIAPTENDIIFRKQLVHGYVHDQGAAMLGGVCGHAGLFSNSNDLAKLMQFYLNMGKTGESKIIKRKTIELFTSRYDSKHDNRRGLGFDKPESDTTKNSPVCKEASLSSYGHSGFTGVLVWADPEYDLIYIFLSNRVYPDAVNNKLLDMNIRTDIQSIIYKSITNTTK